MIALPAPTAIPVVPETRTTLDSRTLIRQIAAQRSFVISTCLTFLVVATVYCFCAKPSYQADALLRVKNAQDFLHIMLDKSQQPADPWSKLSAASDEGRVLESRAILGPVVDTHRLAIEAHPLYFPLLGRGVARLLSILSDDKPTLLDPPWASFLGTYAWGGEELSIGRFDVPERWEDRKFILTLKKPGVYGLRRGNLTLVDDAKVGDSLSIQLNKEESIFIQVTNIVARPGTRFTLKRVSRPAALRNLRKALKIKISDKDSQVIELSLDGEEPNRTATILNSIISTYESLSRNWDTEEAKQRLNFIETQLPEVKARLEVAEEKLNQHRSGQRTFNFSTEAKAVLEQTVREEARLDQLRQQRAVLSQKFTSAYSDFGPIDAQIAVVQAGLNKLNQRAAALPGAEQTQLRYARDVEVNKELYMQLLHGLHEQQIATAGSMPAVRVIDNAIVPDEVSWPKPVIVLPVALFIGILISLARIIAKQQHGVNVVAGPIDMETTFGGPVYAHIPYSKTELLLSKQLSSVRSENLNASVLASLYPDDSSVESLRSLRTILQQKLRSARNNIIMITSPGNGMGKSFVAANLATVFAAVGSRVLIIDGDLRRGRLHHLLGVQRSPGLIQAATGEFKLQDVVSLTTTAKLFAVSRGSSDHQRPSELLAEPALHSQLEAVSHGFDVVIIDTPPVLDVADAAILGRSAGLCIMLVKAGAVTVQEVYESYKRLQLSGVTIDGYIINALDTNSNRDIYGYSAYNYSDTSPRKLQSLAKT